jgi:hypothetical protein
LAHKIVFKRNCFQAKLFSSEIVFKRNCFQAKLFFKRNCFSSEIVFQAKLFSKRNCFPSEIVFQAALTLYVSCPAATSNFRRSAGDFCGRNGNGSLHNGVKV